MLINPAHPLRIHQEKKAPDLNTRGSWPGNPGDQSTLMYLQELNMHLYNLLSHLTVQSASLFIQGGHLYESALQFWYLASPLPNQKAGSMLAMGMILFHFAHVYLPSALIKAPKPHQTVPIFIQLLLNRATNTDLPQLPNHRLFLNEYINLNPSD